MTTYSLNFTIDDKGVGHINDKLKQQITIVKAVGGAPSTTTVAWLTFAAAPKISVTWEESYWLYATNVQYQAGAVIESLSITDKAALTSNLYTFKSDNLFWSEVLSNPTSSFQLSDQVGTDNWQFGLAQMATVSGTITQAVPLNIVPVGNGETASFTPEVTVSIFLQSFSNNGVVITNVTSDALPVTLSSANPSANIGFDDHSNTFVPSAKLIEMAQARRRALGADARRV